MITRPSSTIQLGVLGGAVALEVKLTLLLLGSTGKIEVFRLELGGPETGYKVNIELVENVPFDPGEVTLLKGDLVG